MQQHTKGEMQSGEQFHSVYSPPCAHQRQHMEIKESNTNSNLQEHNTSKPNDISSVGLLHQSGRWSTNVQNLESSNDYAQDWKDNYHSYNSLSQEAVQGQAAAMQTIKTHHKYTITSKRSNNKQPLKILLANKRSDRPAANSNKSILFQASTPQLFHGNFTNENTKPNNSSSSSNERTISSKKRSNSSNSNTLNKSISTPILPPISKSSASSFVHNSSPAQLAAQIQIFQTNKRILAPSSVESAGNLIAATANTSSSPEKPAIDVSAPYKLRKLRMKKRENAQNSTKFAPERMFSTIYPTNYSEIDWFEPPMTYNPLHKRLEGSAVEDYIDPALNQMDDSGESLKLLLADWLQRYYSEEIQFSSKIMFIQLKFNEMNTITAEIDKPNAFSTFILADLLIKYINSINFTPTDGNKLKARLDFDPNSQDNKILIAGKQLFGYLFDILLCSIYSSTRDSNFSFESYAVQCVKLLKTLECTREQRDSQRRRMFSLQLHWQKVISIWKPVILASVQRWQRVLLAIIMLYWQKQKQYKHRRRGGLHNFSSLRFLSGNSDSSVMNFINLQSFPHNLSNLRRRMELKSTVALQFLAWRHWATREKLKEITEKLNENRIDNAFTRNELERLRNIKENMGKTIYQAIIQQENIRLSINLAKLTFAGLKQRLSGHLGAYFDCLEAVELFSSLFIRSVEQIEFTIIQLSHINYQDLQQILGLPQLPGLNSAVNALKQGNFTQTNANNSTETGKKLSKREKITKERAEREQRRRSTIEMLKKRRKPTRLSNFEHIYSVNFFKSWVKHQIWQLYDWFEGKLSLEAGNPMISAANSTVPSTNQDESGHSTLSNNILMVLRTINHYNYYNSPGRSTNMALRYHVISQQQLDREKLHRELTKRQQSAHKQAQAITNAAQNSNNNSNNGVISSPAKVLSPARSFSLLVQREKPFLSPGDRVKYEAELSRREDLHQKRQQIDQATGLSEKIRENLMKLPPNGLELASLFGKIKNFSFSSPDYSLSTISNASAALGPAKFGQQTPVKPPKYVQDAIENMKSYSNQGKTGLAPSFDADLFHFSMLWLISTYPTVPIDLETQSLQLSSLNFLTRRYFHSPARSLHSSKEMNFAVQSLHIARVALKKRKIEAWEKHLASLVQIRAAEAEVTARIVRKIRIKENLQQDTLGNIEGYNNNFNSTGAIEGNLLENKSSEANSAFSGFTALANRSLNWLMALKSGSAQHSINGKIEAKAARAQIQQEQKLQRLIPRRNILASSIPREKIAEEGTEMLSPTTEAAYEAGKVDIATQKFKKIMAIKGHSRGNSAVFVLADLNEMKLAAQDSEINFSAGSETISAAGAERKQQPTEENQAKNEGNEVENSGENTARSSSSDNIPSENKAAPLVNNPTDAAPQQEIPPNSSVPPEELKVSDPTAVTSSQSTETSLKATEVDDTRPPGTSQGRRPSLSDSLRVHFADTIAADKEILAPSSPVMTPKGSGSTISTQFRAILVKTVLNLSENQIKSCISIYYKHLPALRRMFKGLGEDKNGEKADFPQESAANLASTASIDPETEFSRRFINRIDFARLTRRYKLISNSCSAQFIEQILNDKLTSPQLLGRNLQRNAAEREKLKEMGANSENESEEDENPEFSAPNNENNLYWEDFIELILRVAGKKYFDLPEYSASLQLLLGRDLFASDSLGSRTALADGDFRSVVAAQCDYIFDKHHRFLRQVFNAYCVRKEQENHGVEASMTKENFDEFIEHSLLIGKKLIAVRTVASVWLNAQMDEEGEVGGIESLFGGEDFMVFFEFLESLAALACYHTRSPYFPLDVKLDALIAYLQNCPQIEAKRKTYALIKKEKQAVLAGSTKK
jgi:hypothetical protein